MMNDMFGIKVVEDDWGKMMLGGSMVRWNMGVAYGVMKHRVAHGVTEYRVRMIPLVHRVAPYDIIRRVAPYAMVLRPYRARIGWCNGGCHRVSPCVGVLRPYRARVGCGRCSVGFRPTLSYYALSGLGHILKTGIIKKDRLMRGGRGFIIRSILLDGDLSE